MIYVASSWRNEYQPHVVKWLVDHGHFVYDFRHEGFTWQEIDPAWESWSIQEYTTALFTPPANKGFERDFNAMLACSACVLVVPSGHSAHLEAGWCVGHGKAVCVFAPNGKIEKPELMYRLVRPIIWNYDDLTNWAQAVDPISHT